MSLFGRYFRVFTFGQSHSPYVGCVVEGFPSNFSLNLDYVQYQLNRRRPGQSSITTPRDQKDKVSCVSGLENSVTLGSPLCFMVPNENIKKKDYEQLRNIPRPGHADFTYLKKYGIKAESGGGRSSARQTIGRVIAGAVAKQFLQTKNIKFSSYVKKISTTEIPVQINKKLIFEKISNNQVEDLGIVYYLHNGKYSGKTLTGQWKSYNPKQKSFQPIDTFNQQEVKQVYNTRCPHFQTAAQMVEQIKEAKQNKNSVGGIIQGCIYNLPQGLGDPVFDKLPALMAHAMLSIPATKGFQYGSGFGGTSMAGSQHNDKFDKNLRLITNHSGGTLGGISSGQTFYYNVAFKPVSSIGQPQETHTFDSKPITLETKGRHDPCVLPRAPPIVDNMAAMVIMDLVLAQNSLIFDKKYF